MKKGTCPSPAFRLMLFFALAFLISWLLWLPSILNGLIENFPQPLLILGQLATLGPLAAALIVLSKQRGGIAGLFKSAWNWRFKKTWLLAIVFVPVFLTGAALIIKLVFEGGGYQPDVAPTAIPLTIIMIFFAGGPLEEFGWRGYALPLLLKKTSPLWASLILGALHGLWHLPLCFIPNTVQSAMPFWEFFLATAVGAVIFTWIYIGTGSLTAAILYHWTGNIASALIAYWHTDTGRWAFFILQAVFAAVVVLTARMYRRQTQKA